MGAGVTLGACFALQLYLLRELAAAEILFGVVFVVLLLAGVSVYVVGTLAERGYDLFAAHTEALVNLHRRFREILHHRHAFTGHP